MSKDDKTVKPKITKKAIFLLVMGIAILPALIAFGVSFFFFLNFFDVMGRFGFVQPEVVGKLSAAISLLITFVYLSIRIKNFRLKRKVKFAEWLKNNWARFTLWETIVIILLVSLRAEVIWTITELKEVLNVSWTIFGITSALFLSWEIINSRFLDRQKRRIDDLKESTDKTSLKYDTISLLSLYKQRSSSINFLTVNVFLLVAATVNIYLGYNGIEVNLFNQNLVIICMFFCLNSIVDMFFGIAKILKTERKAFEKDLTALQNESTNNQDKKTDQKSIFHQLETFNNVSKLDENYSRRTASKLFKSMSKPEFWIENFEELTEKYKSSKNTDDSDNIE